MCAVLHLPMSQATPIITTPERPEPEVKLTSLRQAIQDIETENKAIKEPIKIGVSDVAFSNLKTDFPTCP